MATNFFQKIQSEGQRFWQSLSRTQKIILGTLAGAALAAIIFIGVWAQNPEWTPLYSKLDTKDAGDIVNKIKETKIPYQLSENGTTILVPAKNVHDLRLQLASEGLPKHGQIGFELFDKQTFGMTDFMQKLNYQRALQGELERTISQIAGVEQARVHLVIPSPELFTEKEKETTASVVLKLKPEVQLTEQNVRSVSHLVSSSVEGLKEENITITDTNGAILFDKEMLSKTSEKAKLKLNTDQLDLQKTVEDKIKYNVQSMLDKIVGSGNSVARVSADLDFDQEEIKSETYTPNADQTDTKSVRSERSVEEAGQGKNINPGGVPGVTPNIPSYQETVGEGQTSFSRKDTTKNYEVPKTITSHVKSPGKIKRLSVSVAVNNVDPSNTQMLDDLRKMVIAAAGIDLARGDNVSVTGYSFDTTATERNAAAMDAQQKQQFYLQLGGIILAAVALLALLASLRMAFGRKVPELPPPEPVPELLPPLDEESPYQLLEPEDLLELTEARNRREVAVKSLTQLAKDDPANMARLLKAWIET